MNVCGAAEAHKGQHGRWWVGQKQVYIMKLPTVMVLCICFRKWQIWTLTSLQCVFSLFLAMLTTSYKHKWLIDDVMISILWHVKHLAIACQCMELKIKN